MTTNNVDAALTPEPKNDLWDDHDEPTEVTGKANSLIVGTRADDLFAAAHAVGAELRELRRLRRSRPEQQEQPPETSAASRVGLCSDCGKYVVLDGWHANCGYVVRDGSPVSVAPAEFDVDEYYDRLATAHVPRAPKQRNDVEPEWREPPNYPGYAMHSVTRELRRLARDTITKDGRTRHYDARAVKETNGAFSLSVNGTKSSRGVQALWAETFPEYAAGTTKKDGEWEVDH